MNGNTFTQNISDLGSLHQHQQGQDIGISLIEDNHSQVSLEKEKAHQLDDMSAHSGSIAMGAIPENMSIGDNLDDDQQSLHVQFHLDVQSANGSVATDALVPPREEVTPPSSPRNAPKSPNAKRAVNGTKTKKNKKKKKKKRFAMDDVIELDAKDLRVKNVENADFIHRAGRDALHIWREFPLSSLDFDKLLSQPLSRLQFGKLPDDVAKRFALCNQEKPRRDQVDELADINVLKDGEDVEKGRDDGQGMEHDLSLPMNDLSMNDALNLDDSIQDHHLSLNENQPFDGLHDDDNASTIDSVMNDTAAVPNDPLFDENVAPLEMGDFENDGEDDDMKDKLEFNTEDQDTLTQAPFGQKDGDSGSNPRDWSKRAKKTFVFFKNKEEEEFSFDELMKSQKSRNTVVGVFYELLVFKNTDLVDLQQEEPFGDITITKTDNFHRHAALSQKLSQRIGH